MRGQCSRPRKLAGPRRTLTAVSDDPDRLEAIRTRREQLRAARKPLDPLVGGPEHELLARQVATELRALTASAGDLAALVTSWQYLAGMCGLFDELPAAERPDSDWRKQIEEALAAIEEATA